MLRNYLAAAMRNLARNRTYAAINIIGLCIGFATMILIATYVRHETSFERFLPGHEDVYRLSGASRRAVTGSDATDDLRGPIAAQLKLEFPQIRSIAEIRNTFGGVSLRSGQVESLEPAFTWADPDVFEVLRFPVIAGEIKTALAAPDGLVLTRRMARKYFGTDLPLGQTLEVDRRVTLRVTAVLEDLPSTTHLNTEIFGRALPVPPGLVYRTYVYLRLAPGASADELRAALPGFIDRHLQSRDGARLSDLFELQLVPIGDIHLRRAGALGMKPAGDPRLLRALALVGLLILFVATINFVNLMTARAARRAVEVGVRKAAGGTRAQLAVQFIGEAILYVLLGLLLAIAAVELALPHLNAFLDREMRFDYLQPAVLASLCGLAILVGTLAGAYPAFVLTAFRPAVVLKGRTPQATGSARLRQLLVLLQFAVLIGLILATGVIQQQTRFALQQGLRFDHDKLLTINVPVADCENSAFTTAVRALPGVAGTACENDFLGNYGTQQYRAPDGREVTLQNSGVGPGLFELLGLHPVAGRFFERGRAADTFPSEPRDLDAAKMYHTVINETAVRQLGFAAPSAAIGQTFAIVSGVRAGTRREIIGVVPDFARDSVRTAIAPMLYVNTADYFIHLNVKLRGARVPETLRAIDGLWKAYSPLPAPISRQFYEQYVENLYGEVRRQGLLFEAFATIALLLAALGIFGLSAYMAELRTREIGIRKATGASTGDVLRLLLWQFTKPVLWANVVAWPLAAWLMQRWLRGFAYHIELQPWLFVVAAGVALAIALLTVSVHSIRVARAGPVSALRCE
ncbi:MAG: FtsX-like permease family protein [Pseudomonadota bacterium]